MTKEYEISLTVKPDSEPVNFTTDIRRLARAAKELAIENGMTATVNRTAKREVNFAGIAKTRLNLGNQPVNAEKPADTATKTQADK